ncbi:hypothetical protein WJX77_001682 [Trebouxia sp. C0004]
MFAGSQQLELLLRLADKYVSSGVLVPQNTKFALLSHAGSPARSHMPVLNGVMRPTFSAYQVMDSLGHWSKSCLTSRVTCRLFQSIYYCSCWQLSSFRFLPTLASSNRGSLSSTEGACQIETKLDTENVCRLSLIINRISAKLKKGKTDKETESGPVLVLI